MLRVAAEHSLNDSTQWVLSCFCGLMLEQGSSAAGEVTWMTSTGTATSTDFYNSLTTTSLVVSML
jgi:hypothetical protein